jgi:RNA polymerase subunit RPABC4/transcription elongation factor Spt4
MVEYYECSNCGRQMNSKRNNCPSCGALFMYEQTVTRGNVNTNAHNTAQPPPPSIKEIYLNYSNIQNRNKTTAIKLWFFGVFGLLQLHAFYLSFFKTAAIKLLIHFITLIVIIDGGFSAIFQSAEWFIPVGANVLIFIWNIMDFIRIVITPEHLYNEKENL